MPLYRQYAEEPLTFRSRRSAGPPLQNGSAPTSNVPSRKPPNRVSISCPANPPEWGRSSSGVEGGANCGGAGAGGQKGCGIAGGSNGENTGHRMNWKKPQYRQFAAPPALHPTRNLASVMVLQLGSRKHSSRGCLEQPLLGTAEHDAGISQDNPRRGTARPDAAPHAAVAAAQRIGAVA